jgi:rhodanese-related sulfurtransferase
MAMRGEISVNRGIAVILIAGAALGLAHNWAGLRSHPPRGIPWIATKAALPELGSVAPSDTGGAAREARSDPEGPGSQATSAAPPLPRREGAGTAAPPATGSSGPAAATGRPAADTRAATPSHGAEGAAATGPDARTPPPLPFIPALDHPVEVRLATVKLFFDAGAALFLDARDAAEYEAGHIPGALRLTSADLAAAPERLKTLPVAGKPIIAYCEGGECEASRELAAALVDGGYRKVLVFTGGFPEWSAAGYAVERGKGGP